MVHSSVSLGGVSPSAKSQRRRANRDGTEEDASARAARRAAWRAARLRSLEQVTVAPLLTMPYKYKHDDTLS